MGLLDLIVKTGIAGAINSMPESVRGNQEAMAETIENNVRSKIINKIINKIIKEHLNDPAYYEKMSALLELASRIDATVKIVRPDEWRGVPPKEAVIKQALFPVLGNEAEVERF